MRTLSKTTNFAVSHMIKFEILASSNCEIAERGKYYDVSERRKLMHTSFNIKIITGKIEENYSLEKHDAPLSYANLRITSNNPAWT
jgi:hypothetical protein